MNTPYQLYCPHCGETLLPDECVRKEFNRYIVCSAPLDAHEPFVKKYVVGDSHNPNIDYFRGTITECHAWISLAEQGLIFGQ